MKRLLYSAALVVGLGSSMAAQANGIVSSATTFVPTTQFDFDGFDGRVVAPSKRVWLDSDNFVTTDAGATLGAAEQDLGGNGLWGARFDLTPTGSGNFFSATGPVLFSFFGGPQAQVGAYFNVSQPLSGSKSVLLTLTAYSAANQVLESFSYNINTAWDSYNAGSFLGFSRSSADIHSFGVTVSGGQSLVMDNLSLSVSPVPEPESLALLLLGLVVIGGVARYRARLG